MRCLLTFRSWLPAAPLVLAFALVLVGCTTLQSPFPSGTSQRPQVQNPPSVTLPQSQTVPHSGPLIRGSMEPPPPPVESQQQASIEPPPRYEPPVRQTVQPGGLVRVGLLLPLSGPSAEWGESLKNAALLAMFEMGNDRFVLQPYDTKGTPEGAVGAVRLAISQGVQLIIGPLMSGSVKAVTPYAQAAGVNVIAFSNDPSAASEGVYIMGFLLQQQINRVVAHARSAGVEKFAALIPNTMNGRLLLTAYKRAIEQYGGQFFQSEVYDPNSEDFSEVVKRLADYNRRHRALIAEIAKVKDRTDEISKRTLKRLETQDTLGNVEFGALLLPESGGRLRALAALLPYYDIDPESVSLLGTMAWNEEIALGSEPALVGALYAAPPEKGHQDFVARYQDFYGKPPLRIASMAYDAVALAAMRARQPGAISFSRDDLVQATGFYGVDGLFRLLSSGSSERGLAVMQVTRDGVREVSPAVGTFKETGF